MSSEHRPPAHTPPPPQDEPWAELRALTAARIALPRAGASLATAPQLDLRLAHARARDAVHAQLDEARLVEELAALTLPVLAVASAAADRTHYLMRPDLGRRLDDAARETVVRQCSAAADVQVVIGDGLSVAAVAAQVPALLPLLEAETRRRGWTFGRPFAVRYCRVGVLDDVGELLDAAVVVLLIGERPGLATAESLSAYLAYRPRAGHTDAQRNLISNIHARGVPPEAAAPRVLALADKMRQMQTSGVAVKEDLAALPPPL